MGIKIKGQYMNRSTFRTIKYMNGSIFSRARYMARTPVPHLHLSPKHRGLKIYQVCSNDDRRLTFDLFYDKVKFASLYILHGENVEKSFSQSVKKTNG